MGGTWFVKMVWGVGGWCVICIGKRVEMGLWWCVKGQMGNVNYEVQ